MNVWHINLLRVNGYVCVCVWISRIRFKLHHGGVENTFDAYFTSNYSCVPWRELLQIQDVTVSD